MEFYNRNSEAIEQLDLDVDPSESGDYGSYIDSVPMGIPVIVEKN